MKPDKRSTFRNNKVQPDKRPPVPKSSFFQRDNTNPNQKSLQTPKPFRSKRNTNTFQSDGVKEGRIEKVKTDKKPFDKKQWRIKKYSNKYKLEQWEENRKKAVLREYYKENQSGQPTGQKYIENGFDEAMGTDSEEEMTRNPQIKENPKFSKEPTNFMESASTSTIHSEKESIPNLSNDKHRKSAYHKANLEIQRLKDEKFTKKDVTESKKEKDSALAKYKKLKAEKSKKLSKKTKKGQPFMKDRLQMLLEQIQKTAS